MRITTMRKRAKKLTRRDFAEYESRELVRVVWEPDCEEYQMGDAEDEEETRRLISQEGVCGMVGQWRPNEEAPWQTADSVWGIIGTPRDGAGYLIDIETSCIVALDAYHRREAEALSARATYATGAK